MKGFPGGSDHKGSACEVGDPGLGRSPGGGYGNSLQYPGLGNPMAKGTGGLWSMRSQGLDMTEYARAHTGDCR